MTTLAITTLKSKQNSELLAIPNENGHLFYQFKINGNVRWYFRAYEYEEDGITSKKIYAPFGLAEEDYEGAFEKLISYFKVA